jgi:hypothetical protein
MSYFGCQEAREIRDKLKGQIIKELNVSETYLYITTKENTYRFTVEGDCCSYSYFYEISNVFQMLDKKILDIEKIEMPDPESPDEYTSVAAYGYKIITDGGYGLVVFRNDSNGYYGGYISDCTETRQEIENTTSVKDEWNA